MNERRYNTLQECEVAIQTVMDCGLSVPDWMQRQYDAFKAAEKAKEVAKDSETPIYDTLVANYPYGTMPDEKSYICR